MPKYKIISSAHHTLSINSKIRSRDEVVDASEFTQEQIRDLLAKGIIKQVG